MTKAELIAAMAAAPDDANVYIDEDDCGLLRSPLKVEVYDDDGPSKIIFDIAPMRVIDDDDDC